MRPASRSQSRLELNPNPAQISPDGVPDEGAISARSAEAEAFEREYPGSSWLASVAYMELGVVGAKTQASVATVARRHGLSHAALNALAVIEGAGEPMPTGEVGARMHVTTGTITSVLDTLERNGYVVRLADPDDRRRVLVDITSAAQTLLDQLLPEVQQLSKAAMGVLDDAQIEQLLQLLASLNSAIDSLPDELPPPKPRRPPRRLRRS